MNFIEASSEDKQSALLKMLENLCGIFWGPDPEKCKAMLTEAYWVPFSTLDPSPEYDPSVAFDEARHFVQDFSDAEDLFNTLEAVYVRLFVSAREGTTAPLYASCYEFENAPLMGSPALLMLRLLESKGLNQSDAVSEPPDHIAIELEYLYFLLESGWRDNREELIQEARSFVSANMLPWVKKFHGRLLTGGDERFYAAMVTMLVSILRGISFSEEAPLI